EDPVQPGSLGLEMALQVLRFFILQEGLADGIVDPRFEPIALDQQAAWKLRGQITHDTRLATLELEILELQLGDRAVTVVGSAWLWSDDTRVYHIKRIGLRVCSGAAARRPAPVRVRDDILDPAVDRWVGDHRPNYTIPVVPLMSIVDRLAGAAQRYC